MKKNSLLKILFVMSIMLPLHVKALATTTSVSCTPAKVSSGDTVTCTFSANITEGNLAGYSAKYDLSDGVVYVANSFGAGSQLPELTSGNNGFSLMKATGVTGKVTLGSSKFTVTGNSGSYKIGLKEIDLSDSSSSSSSENDKSTTVRIVSSDNTLSNLSIAPDNYSEDKITNIVKDTTNDNIVASAVVDASKLKVTATTNDTNATLTGTGVLDVDYGVNKFNIVVTAESGAKKTYTLTVVRPDHRSNNNFLKSLKIKGYDIDFNKGKLEYTINVSSSVKKLDIETALEDSSAKVEIKNNDNFKMGKNEVLIIVTAENETVKQYKIIVEKDMIIKVPDTAAGRSILAIIISLILIGSGSYIIMRTKNKNLTQQ